jgi:hypothetical protein
MHCARCGQPANPGDGAICRFCNGPLVPDDQNQAYGAANPHDAANPAAKKRRGFGIKRGAGSMGGILLTILIIVGVRVGLHNVIFGGGTSTLDASATSFTDPLTSSVFPWANDANAYFRSDGYHIVKSVIVYAPVDPEVNVDVSVRVTQLSGDDTSSYGIVFRRASKGNFYAFEIDSRGEWDFIKDVNNQVTAIVDVTSNAAIHTGLHTTNMLEVQTNGSHYAFLVNDIRVGQADDTTFTSRGKVGLDGNDGTEVVYSHLSMKWHN